MEPNENIPKQLVRPVNPAGAGTPRPAARPVARPVAPRPVVSAPVAEPVEAAEPKEPTFDNGPSVVGKKERKTGWVLALILLFIIAAGGVGFGVWAYLDGNTQKDQLNSQINDLQQQNTELQDELASSNNTTINIDTNGEAVNTADYIYVGEWGMKIKIPDNLKMVSYKFNQSEKSSINSIGVLGTVGDVMSSFVNPSNGNASLGVVTRVMKGIFDGAEFDEDFGDNPRDCSVGSRLVFSVGDYNYCYAHPNGLLSIDESETNLETQSVEVIESMLTNAENYSAI